MKVVMKDNLLVLYLNRFYIKSLDFNSKENLQNYIKKLLLKLQNNYDLKFDGYYDITLYVDKNYGVIIEIEKEELEYFEYFKNGIEINTKLIEDSFLYETNDIIKDNNFLTYVFKDHIYFKIKNRIEDIKMGQILEKIDKIIYGNERKNIIKQAKIVR